MSDKLTLANEDLRVVITFLHGHMKTPGRFVGSASYTDKLMVFCDDWWMRLGDDQKTTQPENLRRKLEWFFKGDQATVLSSQQFLSLLHTTCYHIANSNIHDDAVTNIIETHVNALNIVSVSEPPQRKAGQGSMVKMGGGRFQDGVGRATHTFNCTVLG